MPRIAAAIVAIVCWAGLAVQFSATYGHHPDVLGTVWILLRFFTVITNFLVAMAMSAVALGRRVSPFLLGGVTLAILLVGIVYALLLRGLVELSGGALLADLLLHKVSPVLMPLWWLVFAQHRQLRRSAPAWWSLYPLLYFGYALVRGALGDRYPYPFMDVGRIGAAQTAINAVGIAAGFLVAGYALVWLDRRLPRS
jgi:hypothetical protein